MEEKIFNKEFIKICFVNFLMMFGQNMTNTLVPKYANALGASSVMIGMITGFFSVSSFIIKPVSSTAIDSLDRKKILFVASVVISLGFVGFSISTTPEMLLICRLIHGFGIGFTVTGCLTMVSSTVSSRNLTTAVAYYSVAGSIAQAIGPGIGLSLAGKIGYPLTFLSGAVFTMAGAFVLLLVKEEEREKNPFKLSLNSSIAKEALVPAFIMLFLAMVYIDISSFLTIYADQVGIENIGLYFTVNAVCLFFTRPLIAKLSDKLGIVRLLPVAILCFGISIFMLGFSTELYQFLISAVINAFGYGACQPMIQSLCMKSAPKEKRGAASSTSYYGTDIGYMVGPVIAGKVVELSSYATMFKVVPLLLVPALLLVAVFRQRIMEIDAK
mgnify:CR=1 FL=1